MTGYVRCACCAQPIPATADDVGLTVTCPRTRKLVPVKAADVRGNAPSTAETVPLGGTLPDPPKPLRVVAHQPETELEEEEEEESDYDPRADRKRQERRARAKRMALIKLALIVLCVVGIVVGIQVGMERVRLVDQGKAKFR